MTHDRRPPLLIIPAAGRGSRLSADAPKFLALVGGRLMIEWLVERYQPHVSGFALIVAPAFVDVARDQVCGLTTLPVEVCSQAQPTGMLDAVLAARPAVEASAADRIWVTWCDQLAIDPATIERLGSDRHRQSSLTMPTVWRRAPYIHFDRDAAGRICGVRQRREGDHMPEVGEGDAGLFSFSRAAYLEALPVYAATVTSGTMTGERNLLPFIPWLAARSDVATFECVHDMEAVGINTPEELQQVEAFLLARLRR